MTNALTSIVLLSPAPPDHCKELVAFGYEWGGWFIVASFWFAVIGTAATIFVALYKVFKAPAGGDVPRGPDPGNWAKFLDALKGVLEALAALPAWIAIYLAGLALLWVAGHHSGMCPG